MPSFRLNARALSGGLATGIGASAIFVVALIAIAARTAFPLVQVSEGSLFLVILAIALAASLVYACLVARTRKLNAWWRVLIVGASLPLAGAGGLLFASLLEPLGTSRSDLTLPVFRVAFVSASFLVAFVCSYIGAATYEVPRALRRALEVALITAATYFVCALALDVIPGFHVGGGDHAMPRVAAVCNFIAGLVGGYAAFGVLTRRSPGSASSVDWSVHRRPDALPRGQRFTRPQ